MAKYNKINSSSSSTNQKAVSKPTPGQLKMHARAKNLTFYLNAIFPYIFVVNTYTTLVDAKDIKVPRSLFFFFCSLIYLISYTIMLVSYLRKK